MTKIPTQMLKGILENAILLIIDQGETYGYALQQQLVQNGFGNIPQGTIYPLLLKLQHQELIEAHKKSSSTGPDRKYYQITPKGQQQLQVFLPQWQQLQQAMSKLMGNKGES
ncbi:PadR family transcriptional regulator [Bombilactobacillus mellis]|uniref:PadR family transcriptional regulator n=1 Tax=Bombilactobacillus mellis TaxID=1218508 RepID=A0A0F4KR32_9LACO|nr:PadR family transcriptional regulator [Bombilactobacillus mellis]KJY48503.1 PadR family transcriptional regulator [Bombilactobacillus mellis]